MQLDSFHEPPGAERHGRICGKIGADWVKTSTGYAGGGATVEDLILMRKHAPPHVQVKAAGGVRDLDTLLKVRSLGVTRVGSTRTRSTVERLHSPPWAGG